MLTSSPLSGAALTLGLAAVVIVTYDAVIFGRAVLRSRAVSEEAVAYSQTPEPVTGRLLVVGDSTAVGTGSESPRQSIAGRIGEDFPGLFIENRGNNGALTEAVVKQIAAAQQPHYDAILIQVGGNDALRFTARARIESALRRALTTALKRSDRVALMSTGDLGDAPAIPWPVSHIFRRRAEMIRELFSQVAREKGLRYVDLFRRDDQDNPFRDKPRRYYARDGLHPAGPGYALWYATLREQVPLDAWFGPRNARVSPDTARRTN